MDTILIITILIAAVALTVAAILFLRYRRVKRKNAHTIVQYLRQQDRIARELEHTRIEKETLERIIINGLDKLTQNP